MLYTVAIGRPWRILQNDNTIGHSWNKVKIFLSKEDATEVASVLQTPEHPTRVTTLTDNSLNQVIKKLLIARAKKLYALSGRCPHTVIADRYEEDGLYEEARTFREKVFVSQRLLAEVISLQKELK